MTQSLLSLMDRWAEPPITPDQTVKFTILSELD